MKLHNTLTRQTEEFTPLTRKVRIYTCGPTVYDHIHIGNLRSFIFADTLRRAISGQGTAVEQVMNITDIDDKTITRSRERYADLEPRDALHKLTQEYSQIFLNDMEAVGVDMSAIELTRATDHITGMQTLIRQLLTAGYAYLADDGVYFSIEVYRRSGKTYGQLTEITASSTSNSRIQNDEYDKVTAHDFALWKRQKSNEPAWPFLIDGQQLDGRPGWHIECSVMSQALLSQPFDIHTGGVDLIFPHHENEIAQSTALHDSPMYAQLFAHNEHLLVDGKKMSKSLNNFYTLETVQAKGFDALALRLLVLQSHYRTQSHFSWENLQAAQNRLREFQALAVLRWQPRRLVHDAGTFTLEDVPVQLADILANDLNTPQALALLSDVTTQLSTVLIEEDMVDHFENMLRGIDDLLGLQLMKVPDINDAQKQILAHRDAARQSKDWAKSDELRDHLLKDAIGLRDTSEGAIWFRL